MKINTKKKFFTLLANFSYDNLILKMNLIYIFSSTDKNIILKTMYFLLFFIILLDCFNASLYYS